LKKVSIIVVNYNGKNQLEACLKSLVVQSFDDVEIIFVDNASSDNSIEYVRDVYPNIMALSLSENKGFAGGNLEGLKHAGGQYIMLLNNDTEVAGDCISNLVSLLDGSSDIGICAAKMVVYGTNIIDSAGDGYSTLLKGFKRGEGKHAEAYDTEEYVFGACAGAALYRREMLEEIGFFDEDFFLIHEDTDLSFRAQLAGWKVMFVPTAAVRHKVRSTIGHMSDMAIYYTLRNSEFVRIKNVPLGLFLRCLPAFVGGTISEFVYFVLRHGKLMLYLKAKRDVIKNLKTMLGKRRKIMKMKKVSNKYLYSLMTPIWNREFFSMKINKFFHG